METIIKRILQISISIIAIAFILPYIIAKFDYKEQEEECWSELIHLVNESGDLNELVSNDLNSYQSLIEWSLVTRTNMLSIAEEIQRDTAGPISSKHLEVLKEGTITCLELRDSLYHFALRYECAIDVEDDSLKHYQISQEQKNKAVFISISAALTLYDNYLLGAMIFERDKRLRRLLNDPDKGFGIEANKLAEITLTASSIEKQRRIQKGLDYFLSQPINDSDYQLMYLQSLIKSSPSFKYIQKMSLVDMTKNRFKVFGRLSRDGWAELRKDGFDGLSKFFGNTIGLVETRQGKMFGDKELEKKILSDLQPLDILLEKTPFRLTDKLIPGHFGHVAIWVGDKQGFEELNLWDSDAVSPFHFQLNGSGKQCIVEALRGGVQLSSLEHFLNVDDFAILRPVFAKEGDQEKMKEAMLLAMRQVGKEYDFNFDVNTTEKIVCSELAYVSYPMISWETEKTLGRYTISPDNVAKKCLDGQAFELISFYHDGVEIKEDKRLILFQDLLNKEG